jgi:hypothetical protein
MIFSSFSKINYTFLNGKTYELVDIFKKISFTQTTLENTKIFDTYLITDGSTPEKIAFEYYGDPKFSWFIFMANNIVDPHNEWPAEYYSYKENLSNKYKGTSFFIIATPELLPGDIMIKTNSAGTSLDQDVYSVVLDWRKQTRNVVVYGGEGTFSNNDYVVFLRKEGNGFSIINTNTTSNVARLARRTIPNLDTPKYFINNKNTNKEIISPYRIFNGTTLTNYSADPNTNVTTVPASYTDTDTLYNTVLYKYITNGLSSNFGITVKTFEEYEMDELYKRQTVKIPKQQIISTVYDMYKKAVKTDTLGRVLSVTINI